MNGLSAAVTLSFAVLALLAAKGAPLSPVPVRTDRSKVQLGEVSVAFSGQGADLLALDRISLDVSAGDSHEIPSRHRLGYLECKEVLPVGKLFNCAYRDRAVITSAPAP